MSAPGSPLDHLKPAEFARTGASAQGSIALAGFERLGDSLATKDGNVDYALVGMLTNRGHDALVLQVSTSLSLKCQRCLEAVEVSIEASRKIVFATNPHTLEADYEAEDTDVVDAVDSVEIAQLVEDELLLSIPFSPRHEAGVCKLAVDDEEQGAEEPKKSPFAVLAGLTRNENRN